MGWKRLSVFILVLFSWSVSAYSRESTDGLYKGLDTTFVRIPKQHASVKAFLDFSGNAILAKGSYEDTDFNTDLRSPFLVKQGVALTWRSITLSLGFNLFNKPKNYFKVGLNSYGRKFAFELGFKVDKNFHGTQTFDGIKTEIPSESLRHAAFTADLYYIFNGNRFSYPAAFGQSRIQRKSSGSFILAASSNFFRTRTLKNDDNYDFWFGGITMGIGGGYGYNLVAGNWLFHASVIPTLVIIDSNKLTVDKEKTKISYQFPHFITTANLSIVYNHNKFFTALRGTFHNCTTGNNNSLKVNYIRVNGALCVGWRF